MRTSQYFRAWGGILRGRTPILSIEITKECPLRCPGCYAYEDAHLGEALGKDSAMHIAASKPKALDASGVNAEDIETERRIAIEKARESGKPDAMLEKIADFYDEEVESAVHALTSMLEPLMMVLIGGIVGSIVIGMYLPIFSIVKAIQ